MPRFTGGQESVRELVRGLEANVDIRPLAAALLNKFGSYDGFAEKCLADYEVAPAGGTVRARMLSDITKLLLACTPKDGGAEPDEPEWTDEELAGELTGLGFTVNDE